MGGIQTGTPASSSTVVKPSPDGRWHWLFVWITFIPVVTIPVTAVLTDRIAYGIPGACQVTPGFFGAVPECPRTAILLMLTPGLLNLVPLWWLLSRDPKTRLAALAAGSLGLLRLVVPATAVLASQDGAQTIGSFLWTGFPNAGYGPPFALLGIALWLATFPTWFIVARRGRSTT
jgi:hypothetical protein